MRHRPRTAFSLIELMVVTAVIATLVTMLFPFITGTRHAARRTRCAGNLRQMAVACQFYANDYNGLLPNNGYGPTAGGVASANGMATWSGHNTDLGVPQGSVLKDYANNLALFNCPTDRRAPGTAVSYAMPDAISMQDLYILRRPSVTVLFVGEDESTSDIGAFGDTDDFSTRHENGGVLVYADAHSKYLEPETPLEGDDEMFDLP
jgi:prepilin-type N-terminal cleavage/methylation domain-containing protein